MTYSKTTWVQNNPPYINATNLNKLEQGVADAHAYRGLIDAREFGAVNDNSTNNTTAIANARSAAVTAGVPLLLTGGGTYLTNTQNFTQPLTMIITKGTTLKLRPSQNVDLVSFTSPGCVIRGGGTLDHNGTAQTTGAVVGIYSDGCVVENLELANGQFYGVYLGGASYCRIVGNYVHNTTFDAVYVIKDPTSANYNIIESNRIVSNGACGIKLVGNNVIPLPLRGNRIVANHVESSGTQSIEIINSSDDTVIADNVTRGGDMGISISGCEGVSVTGNTCYSAVYYGLEVAASHNCTVAGNTVDGNATTLTGIAASNTSPSFNTFSANAVRDTVTAGIHLASGIKSVIANNTFDNTVAPVYLQNASRIIVAGNIIDTGNYGFYIDNCQRINVTNNFVNNSTIAGLASIPSTGSNSEIVVTDNDFTSVAVFFSESGTSSVYFARNGSSRVPTQTLVAGTAIKAYADVVYITAGSVITLTGTPVIADGFEGQRTTLVNTGTNAITVPHGTTNNIRLAGAANLALGQYDSLELTYSTAVGDWIQTSAANL